MHVVKYIVSMGQEETIVIYVLKGKIEEKPCRLCTTNIDKCCPDKLDSNTVCAFELLVLKAKYCWSDYSLNNLLNL